MIKQIARTQVVLKNIPKPLILNFMTLEDEQWVRDRFPAGFLEELQNGNIDALLGLFWRLLDNDSKRLIRDLKIVKWEGLNEIAVDFEDPSEKLKAIVGGGKDEEMTAIVNAIFETKDKSNPDPVATQKKSLKADGL